MQFRLKEKYMIKEENIDFLNRYTIPKFLMFIVCKKTTKKLGKIQWLKLLDFHN